MNFRALLRRAFPYIVIGIGGFALAYVVIFVFVLPTEIVPSAPQPHAPDTAAVLQPIDTGAMRTIPPPIEPPQVTAQLTRPAPEDTVPVLVPDMVGMSLPDARGMLDGLRLQAAVSRDTSSLQPPNTVIRQSPLPDSLISVGGTVMLTVSYFPPDSTSDTMRLQPGAGPSYAEPVMPDSSVMPDSLLRPDTLHPKQVIKS